MIDLHYWTTPNGHKITMFLEETGLEYALKPVNLQNDEQLTQQFLEIAPNNKIPAIVDHHPLGGGAPISVFESGAILQYLAEKTGALLPLEARARTQVLQWLYWQVGGVGPMAGQLVFFSRNPEKIQFAIDRFSKETTRLYRVLNTRLQDRAYLVEDTYTIADIASYPWVAHYNLLGQNIDDFPNVERWLDRIAARSSTQRAYDLVKAINSGAPGRPAPRAKLGPAA